MTTAKRHLLGAGAAASLAVAVLLGVTGWVGTAEALPTEFAAFDPGPLTRWGLPVARFGSTAAAVVAVGALLGVLMLDRRPTAAILRRWTPAIALTAALAQALQVVLGVSSVAGRPIHTVPADEFMACLTLPSSLYCLAGAGAFVGVALAARTRMAAHLLLLLALIASAVPFLGGHSSSAPNHTVSTGLMVVHVLTAALWVGGLAMLVLVGAVLRDVASLRLALPPFSRLAAACAAATVLTGLATAVLRAPGGSLYGEPYLALLATKGVAVLGLGGFGAWHRRHLPRLARQAGSASDRAFLRVAGAEVALMLVVLAVATVLSQTPPEPAAS